MLPYTGEVFSLDDNGNITESIFYENGKIKSEKQVYLKWYENGQKMEERNFLPNLKSGYFYSWYDSGQKKGIEK